MDINKIAILGKVSKLAKIDHFKTYFEWKGIPEKYENYIQYYKKWGEHYGVRWDLAICQSILETGRFLFKGSSVKPENFNYAGIGATDENPRPEQFKSPEEGIKAQIQILAIRPGVKIPKGEMLSPRYVKYYDVVFGKQTYWSELAGTWASDKKYWIKISNIAKEFKKVTGIDLLAEVIEKPELPVGEASWFEFNRYDNGKPSVMAYAGDKAIAELKQDSSVECLIAFLEKHDTAKSYLVADTDKPIPHIIPRPNPDPDVEIPEFPGELKKGSEGEEVKVYQKRIKDCGYNVGEVDGIFGPKTEAETLELQKEWGLKVDGVVAYETWLTIWRPDFKDLVGVDNDYGEDFDEDSEGDKKVWIPFAKDFTRQKCPWRYPKGHPEGAIVHFTAGRGIVGSLNYLRKAGYPCLGIGRDGTLYQPFPLNEAGAHSGTWHHKKCVGIEIAAAGRCTPVGNGKFKTWYGKYLDRSQMRYVGSQNANQQPGWYEAYTPEQEKTLIKLLVWLKHNAPDIFNINMILGHDEAVAVTGNFGRKNDPGGALSMTMPELRALIKEEWKKVD